jgi:hypothetical protein
MTNSSIVLDINFLFNFNLFSINTADLWKSNGNESQIVRAEDLCSIFKVPTIEPSNNIWSSIFNVESTQNAGFTSRVSDHNYIHFLIFLNFLLYIQTNCIKVIIIFLNIIIFL